MFDVPFQQKPDKRQTQRDRLHLVKAAYIWRGVIRQKATDANGTAERFASRIWSANLDDGVVYASVRPNRFQASRGNG